MSTIAPAATHAGRRRPRPQSTGGRPSATAIDTMFRHYAATHDPQAREQLVSAHAGLAASLALRFGARHEPQEDLHQAALLGLLHAIDRFDPDRGVQFTTFAWATINGELKRHLRDRTWGLRVPRRVQELYLVTAEATDALTSSLGRSPTVAEVADRIGTSEEDVVEALEARGAYRLASLDTPVGDSDSGGGIQVGGDDPCYGKVDQQSLLASLVRRLPAREQEIIRLRFSEELTQAQIAERVGVSQMHVSRLLSTSLHKLRAWSEGDESAA
ncbi:MAG: SigB/SigF/SigG family RNA polymerase sigma factor [Actinomycetota bacterium]|nr:SigB/SigF/SigG family RNA polymerase sigma factor [Actinomycetota bacterium]